MHKNNVVEKYNKHEYQLPSIYLLLTFVPIAWNDFYRWDFIIFTIWQQKLQGKQSNFKYKNLTILNRGVLCFFNIWFQSSFEKYIK